MEAIKCYKYVRFNYTDWKCFKLFSFKILNFSKAIEIDATVAVHFINLAHAYNCQGIYLSQLKNFKDAIYCFNKVSKVYAITLTPITKSLSNKICLKMR